MQSDEADFQNNRDDMDGPGADEELMMGGLNPEDIVQVIPLDDNDSDEDDQTGEMENNEEDDESPGPPPLREYAFHKDEVYTVDCSPQQRLAASGGKDDRAFIFSTATSSGSSGPMVECGGFGDSVTQVRWHSNGRHVAIGDLSGVVMVWRVGQSDSGDEVQAAVAEEFNIGADLEWLLWHDATDILFAGAKDGNIWMWLISRVKGAAATHCKIYAAGDIACTSGRLLPGGKQLLAGYDDGSVRVWDLKTAQSKICSLTGDATRAESSVLAGACTCVCVHDTHPLAAVGLDTGAVLLVRTDLAQVTAVIDTNRPGQQESNDDSEPTVNSVECVAFSNVPSLCLCVAGGLGSLLVLDLNAGGLERHVCEHTAGVVKCAVLPAPNEHLCVTGSLDGRLRLWDIRDGSQARSWLAHRGNVFDLALVQQQQVVSAGQDGVCRLFDLLPA